MPTSLHLRLRQRTLLVLLPPATPRGLYITPEMITQTFHRLQGAAIRDAFGLSDAE